MCAQGRYLLAVGDCGVDRPGWMGVAAAARGGTICTGTIDTGTCRTTPDAIADKRVRATCCGLEFRRRSLTPPAGRWGRPALRVRGARIFVPAQPVNLQEPR